MIRARLKRAVLAMALNLCCGIIAAPPPAAMAQQPLASTQRGYLGVELRGLTRQEAAALGWHTPRGTVVKKVEPGSPAATANLARGDIVTGVNKLPVEDTAQFLKVIGGAEPGTVVTIRFLRRGKLRAGPVKLGARPDQTAAA